MKVCSSCQANPRRQGQRTCKACHAAYQREWRPRNLQARVDRAVREWLEGRSSVSS